MAKYRQLEEKYYKIEGGGAIEVEIEYDQDGQPDSAYIGYRSFFYEVHFMKRSKAILKKEFMETYKTALKTIRSKV
ncbi:MAG: hypothetical protein AAFQ92_22600 [Bacteroidota bacterium]